MRIEPPRRPAGGFTFIELIIFIVVVSVGLVGILGVLNLAAQHSADPVYPKQALAIAEALMEEIQAKGFSDPASTAAVSTRGDYDDVDEFNGYASSGIHALDDLLANKDNSAMAIAGLAQYNVTVTVAAPGADLNGIAADKIRLINVTVTDPGGTAHTLTGYRLNYD